MVNLKNSYTSADTVPRKLLLNPTVKDWRPIHIQWLPTNHCNLNCSFCSCSNRDRYLEMDPIIAKAVIWKFSSLGCSAVTITGGGEPLCHPNLKEMMIQFKLAGIKIGLVTNGLLLNKLTSLDLSRLTWCRISHSDERHLTETYRSLLVSVISRAPRVDWAFSYVLGENPNLDEIRRVVDFANLHNFTHVRLVADILHPSVLFDPIRQALNGIDQRVIYQPRATPTPATRCVLGYIKPVVAPDFKMYLCCGVQYALDPPSQDLPETLCMGSAKFLDDLYDPGSFRVFKTNCAKCYYHGYNDLLLPITESIRHKEFL